MFIYTEFALLLLSLEEEKLGTCLEKVYFVLESFVLFDAYS